MLIPEQRRPGWLLPLNKHGRFSINAAKIDGAKLKKAHDEIFFKKWASRISIFCLCLIYTVILFLMVKDANAADFSNWTFTPPGTGYVISRNLAGGAQWYMSSDFDFTTTTQQLEIRRIDFSMYRTGTSTVNPYLAIHTNLGTWSVYTTSTIDAYGYSTTTFYYSVPYPAATVGTPYSMSLMSPYEFPVANWVAGNTILMQHSTTTQVTNYWRRDSDSGDVQITGYEPMMRINEGVSGALTLTLPPDMSTYGFGTGTAQSQDFGYLGNMTRDVITWLFVPPAATMNQFNDTLDDIKAKAPLGYFTLAVSEIQGMATSTNPSSTLLTINTSLGSIPFWDTSSTMHSWLIEGIVPYLLGFERVGLWLTFLFYLYERIKDLRL